MSEKDKLSWGMALVFLIAFVGFGYIVIQEKLNTGFLPKAEEAINNYIEKTYNKEIDDFKIENTEYIVKCGCYKTKVTNKDNKDLYFRVTYKRKKITDTYKNDYEKGETLIKTIEDNLTKKIKKLNNDDIVSKTLKVTIDKKLNEFNPSVREEIIKSKNIKEISIYNIEGELIIDPWTFASVNSSVIEFDKVAKEEGFSPSTYTFYITNPNNPGESFKISNLNTSYINEEMLSEIVPAVKRNNKEILNKYNM